MPVFFMSDALDGGQGGISVKEYENFYENNTMYYFIDCCWPDLFHALCPLGGNGKGGITVSS